jgi:hypothetical protein
VYEIANVGRETALGGFRAFEVGRSTGLTTGWVMGVGIETVLPGTLGLAFVPNANRARSSLGMVFSRSDKTDVQASRLIGGRIKSTASTAGFGDCAGISWISSDHEEKFGSEAKAWIGSRLVPSSETLIVLSDNYYQTSQIIIIKTNKHTAYLNDTRDSARRREGSGG